MSWWRTLVLATSACGFQLSPAGSDVDVEVDAPIAADMDLDGDTVADAIDNCPEIANLDQRNHDADLVGDACDLCPHIAGLTDPDADGDGVGDACDPLPAIPSEMRFAWTGFDDPGLPAGWIAASANWTISGGKLRLDGLGRVVLVGPPDPIRAVSVAMAGEVMMVGSSFDNPMSGNTVYPTLGTATGQVPSTQEYACYTFKDNANRMAATSFFNGGYSQSNITWTGDFVVGARFEVVETLAGNNRCEITRVGPPTSMATDNEMIGASSTGRASVFAAASIVEIDYVFIVTAR